MRQILAAIAAVALTDLSLQLDNALAISSIASRLPAGQRLVVVGVGVGLAACCLLAFTLTGSYLVGRIGWLKPVAGLLLVLIGGQLLVSFVLERGGLPGS